MSASHASAWTPIGLGAILIAVALIVATVEIDFHAVPPPTASASGGRDSFHPSPPPPQRSSGRSASRHDQETPRRFTPLSRMFVPPGGSCFAVLARCRSARFLHACSVISPAPTPWSSMATPMPACGFRHSTPSPNSSTGASPTWGSPGVRPIPCPIEPFRIRAAGDEYPTCDQWHRFAIGRIQSLHPDLVIVTQEDAEGPNGETYSPAEWQQGLEKTITSIEAPDRNIVVLGNIPVLESNGPDCLARNPDDVQACSSPFVPFLCVAPQGRAEGGDRPRCPVRKRDALVLLEHLHRCHRKVRGVPRPVSRHGRLRLLLGRRAG